MNRQYPTHPPLSLLLLTLSVLVGLLPPQEMTDYRATWHSLSLPPPRASLIISSFLFSSHSSSSHLFPPYPITILIVGKLIKDGGRVSQPRTGHLLITNIKRCKSSYNELLVLLCLCLRACFKQVLSSPQMDPIYFFLMLVCSFICFHCKLQ